MASWSSDDALATPLLRHDERHWPAPAAPCTLSETIMIRRFVAIAFLIAPLAHAANWPEHPILHAVRVSKSPTIDGNLDDAAWHEAPEFTDFTQHDPDDTKPATMRTSLRIIYDDKAIYFGMQMDDIQHPSAILARRDSFVDTDFVSINIDSQHDRLSGNAL